MIEALKGLYHKYEQQVEVYSNLKKSLTVDQKYDLVLSFDGHDFWGYFKLICDILYEISDDSDRFIMLLSNIYEKIKNDFAQGAFLELLCKLGEAKVFAPSLYEKLQVSSATDNTKVVSGLILGKYALKEKNFSIIQVRMNEKVSFPSTNSLLKSILIFYENKKLPSSVKAYIKLACESEDELILQEVANLCLASYKLNSDLYVCLEKIVKSKKTYPAWRIFDRLRYSDVLNKVETLALIKTAKSYDSKIVDVLVEILQKYPEEYILIVDYVIYWINAGVDKDLSSLDYVLKNVSDKNKLVIGEFIRRRNDITRHGKYGKVVILPHLFAELSKTHYDICVDEILKIGDEDTEIFIELARVLIGNIYLDIGNKPYLIKLTQDIVRRAKLRDFITFEDSLFLSKSKSKKNTKNDFDYIVDFAKNLLEQMKNQRDTFDFSLIRKNLQKYPQLFAVCKDVLLKLENSKKYSSILWLGQTEEPDFETVELSDTDTEFQRALKISHVRSKFWSRAYLKELECAVSKYLRVTNAKVTDKTKKLKSFIENEEQFWSFESELIFMNRFPVDKISAIEPLVPNEPKRQLDLKVNISGRDIYFELVRPEIDRKLKLSNTAIGLDNKSLSLIFKKFKQLFTPKTLAELQSGKRSDAFFVVIDASSSIVDEYHILNSLLGSLAITLEFDKKTGEAINQYPSRKTDSIHHKRKDTSIITGVVFFKQELQFNSSSEPYLKLTGDVVMNPNSVIKLSQDEIKNIRSIIFG